MANFPQSYPGDDDALLASVDLLMHKMWDDPEFKHALAHDYPDWDLTQPLPEPTLPKAIDMMLRAFWREGDDYPLTKILERKDYVKAAEFMRRHPSTPDALLIASRAVVADNIKKAVEKLITDNL